MLKSCLRSDIWQVNSLRDHLRHKVQSFARLQILLLELRDSWNRLIREVATGCRLGSKEDNMRSISSVCQGKSSKLHNCSCWCSRLFVSALGHVKVAARRIAELRRVHTETLRAMVNNFFVFEKMLEVGFSAFLCISVLNPLVVSGREKASNSTVQATASFANPSADRTIRTKSTPSYIPRVPRKCIGPPLDRAHGRSHAASQGLLGNWYIKNIFFLPCTFHSMNPVSD